ncbi:MAG TPA: hypothetical protein VG755_27840 [Nannocystaceae bacterium]|nr:hypothetical protein [Nannocystaceae bacterium]
MSTRIRSLVIATTLLAACGDAPAPMTADAPVASASTAKLPVGRTLVFALDWQVDAGFEQGSPTSLPMGGGIHLAGELHLQAIEQRRDGTLAAVWFDALDTRELTVNGEPLAFDAALLVGQRAWFVLDDAGGITEAWFAPDAPPLFRHVMGGVLDRLDLRSAAAGPQVVPTAHGLGNVVYARTGDTVRRELQSMARLDAVGGVPVEDPQLDSAYELALDGEGLPLRIAADERVRATDERWLFGAHDRFAVERVRIDDGGRVDAPELAALERHDPSAPPDYRESEQAFAQRMAHDLVAKDIALAMTAQDGGLVPSRDFISEATGLLRGWPEEAWAIAPEILAMRRGGRQLGFDVLASAGTPEAQAVMCELLARDDVRSWSELPLLIGRLGMLRRPTSETVHFALALDAWAQQSGDVELARATLYPLGSLARRVEASDPWLAELVHARLVGALDVAQDVDDRLAAIAGLGNHGRVEDRVRLLPLLATEDDRIRAGAVIALRHLQAPEVTDALTIALTDPDRAVATRALDLLADRWPGADGSARLATIASTGAHNPELELALANLLGARMTEDPSVRRALGELALRTHDRDVAERIAEIVES